MMRAARFALDFVVGDDILLAVGVGASIMLTALAGRLWPNTWWVLPVTVPFVVALSLRRAIRRSGAS